MMAAGKKKPEEKGVGSSGSTRSMRDNAEEQLAHSPESSPTIKEQTPEELIHELQVHQIELEMQSEELKKSKLALEESRDKFLDLYDFAPTGILTLSEKGLILEVNLTGSTLLGVVRSKLVRTRFSTFVAPENHDEWYWYITNLLRQEGKQCCTILLKRTDGSAFPARLEGIRLGSGRIHTETRIAFSDITDIKKAEEALIRFSEDLERQVNERTSDLSDVNLKLMTEIEIRLDAEKQLTKTVGEKEVLLREVHHRVKNNLQIIISLLSLQSRYMKDETTLAAFRESKNRIHAIALVHEKFYRSTELTKLDLGNYLKSLGNDLLKLFGMKGKGITLTMDIQDIFLALDTAIPLSLMFNELISNSFKHAFPDGRKGEISLAIHRQDHMLTILFKDTGVGIPKDFEWRNAESLGLRLVCSLVEQLDGTIELDRTGGTTFTIVVKEEE